MTKKPKTLEEYLENSPLTSDNKLIAPITETHCHLDMLKDIDLNALQETLKSMNIARLITIGTSKKNFDKVREIQSASNNIYFTLGTHPHEAKDFGVEDIQYIRNIYNNEENQSLVAVGEIGLDYYYDYSPRETQINVFKQYLDLAIELNLPVVIHTRDADADMLEILEEYAPKMKKKGVVHSFSSGLELGKRAAELGFYLGFNGIITFKNAELVRDAVRQTPLEQILVETDSPFLTPHPFRGRQNDPTYLPLVMEKIAEIKDVPLQEAFRVIESNATSCFFN